MTHIIRVFIVAVSVAVTGNAAFSAPPKVTADVLPIQSLVAQVMDGIGTPSLVVRAGASPHLLSLRPSEARALANAEVVFWAGDTLSPWLSDPLDTIARNAKKVNLLEVSGTRLLNPRQVSNAITALETHSHSDDAGGHDPHAWLDPKNAILWLGAIAAELSLMDPANEDVYRANAKAGQDRLLGFVGSTPSDSGAGFAVYHDAYQYFEVANGIMAPVIISASDASTPGAAHIQKVQRKLQDGRVTCLFAEPSYSRALVARLIEGTDIRVVELDTLGSGFEPGPGLYPKILEQMAQAFEDCDLTVGK